MNDFFKALALVGYWPLCEPHHLHDDPMFLAYQRCCACGELVERPELRN